MKLPQTFLPENKSLERKTEDLLKGYKKETDDSFKLETLKEGKTREEQKEFLKLFAEQISYIIGEVKEEMIRTRTGRVYITKENEDQTRFEIWLDGHLHFIHQISGMLFQADLDDKKLYRYNGYATLYEYIYTYPDKESSYSTPFGDHLKSAFKDGVEMYECIKSFLKNKVL